MTALKLSVLFSTFNGAEKLPLMLESLSELEPLEDGFEVIAVNNASTDGTADVLRSFANHLPLTILEEPRAGKNYALNRAVQIAQGELFVFTDDDVVLPTNFLKGYSELIQQQTDFALFGGSIVPLWGEEPDPRILSEVPMGTAFAATDADRSSGPIPANLLYGPNMAIRRAVFDSGLSFDVSIGPNGGRYVMGDETDLLIRAEAAGFKAYYTPNVVVKHRIRPEQHEISWIERRGYIAGSSMVHNQIRKHGGQLPATKRVAGIPRWALRKLLNAELKAALFQLRSSSQSGRFAARWERGFSRGYASEYRRQRQRLEKG